MSKDPENNSQTTPPAPADKSAEDNKLNDKETNLVALRKSNEALQAKVDELSGIISSKEDADLKAKGDLQGLLDKATKENEELKATQQSDKRQSILEKELVKSGVKASLIDLILPAVNVKVKFSKDNLPENLSEILEGIKTSEPTLFTDQTINKPAGSIGTTVATDTGNGNVLSSTEIDSIIKSGNASLIAANADKINSSLS